MTQREATIQWRDPADALAVLPDLDGIEFMKKIAAGELRRLFGRIARRQEGKKGLSDDIRDVYAEAKSRGYDAKIMRQIVRLRKLETHDRQEMDAILETYRSALNI